jgi:hypothetical protein
MSSIEYLRIYSDDDGCSQGCLLCAGAQMGEIAAKAVCSSNLLTGIEVEFSNLKHYCTKATVLRTKRAQRSKAN